MTAALGVRWRWRGAVGTVSRSALLDERTAMDGQCKRERRSVSPEDGSEPVKRRRLDVAPAAPAPLHPSAVHSAATISDITGSHEIFLNVLSFLDASDLAGVEQVNRSWQQMALDNQVRTRCCRSQDELTLIGSAPHSYGSVFICQPIPSRADGPSGSPLITSHLLLAKRMSRLGSATLDNRRQVLGCRRDLAMCRRAVQVWRASQIYRRMEQQRRQKTLSTGRRYTELARIGKSKSRLSAKMRLTLLRDNPRLRGKASVRSLSSPATPQRRQESRVTSPSPTPTRRAVSAEGPLPDGNLVALSSAFIFTAQPSSPLLQVHLARLPDPDTQASGAIPLDSPVALIPPPPGWSSPSRPEVITSIAVDSFQSAKTAGSIATARLAIFYRSGGWVVLEVRLNHSTETELDRIGAARKPHFSWHRTTVYRHPDSLRRRNRRRHFIPDADDAVTISAFFWPVLISCSNRFFLSIYRVGGLSRDSQFGEPQLLQTLHSPVSFHPATLSLSPVATVGEEAAVTEDNWSVRDDANIAEDIQYRAVLAYASPIYPQSWTVTAQEMAITLPTTFRADPSVSKSAGDVEAGRCYRVARKVRPGGAWHDRRWPWRFGAKGDIVGVKGAAASAIGLDEHWCILAGEDNQIQVYALPHESGKTRGSLVHGDDASTAALHHAQTLLAHSAAITSVALSAGRCVSAARDGRVLVWELDASSHQAEREEREEAEVLARLSRMHEGGMKEIKSVEIRSGAGRGPPHAATDIKLGQPSTSEGAQALRRHLLPEPPVPHPLSLAGVVKEYRFGTTTQRPTATGSSTAGPKTIVRKITFNEEMIAGLVEPVAAESGEQDPVAEQAREAEFVRIWKFDV